MSEERLSKLELRFEKLETVVGSIAGSMEKLAAAQAETSRPKPINWAAWIATGFTAVAMLASVLTMWIKPLELKQEVQAEKMAALEKARKEDYGTLKDGLMERIAYSFDRLKTEMKLKAQTP